MLLLNPAASPQPGGSSSVRVPPPLFVSAFVGGGTHLRNRPRLLRCRSSSLEKQPYDRRGNKGEETLIAPIALEALTRSQYCWNPIPRIYFMHHKRKYSSFPPKKAVLSMRIVGLTGGIASGKSTISNLFKTNNIPVVDADLIARDVVKKGTSGWKKVVATFGEEILQNSREIDRARLGEIVFSDPERRQLLNRLLAPHISSGIFWEIIKLWMKGCKVIVLDIPLLFEAKMDKWTNPIIVVWVDFDTQLHRLMTRDGISEEQARNRINAQKSLDWKKINAGIVIDNSGSLEETKMLFRRILAEVTKPLSWKEFGLSRKGLTWILVSTIIGVLVYRNAHHNGIGLQ